MGPWIVRRCLKKDDQRQFQSGVYQHFQRRTVRQGIADGPRLRRTGGVARRDLYGVSLSSPPTKPTTSNQKLSPFSLKHVGGTFKGEAICRGSRTVRANPRTLLKILHHVLSVFH